ncbi:hypothetical protein CPB86DRAFT_282499 [Serendipita vermifera]|nr:hypothetical protein CPB86DRAFT_282499 [Serendipita vermifera]
MQAEETPPTYSEYPTELPEQFPIGQNSVRPLVNVTELQAHLKLLGAFYELKREVQGHQDGIAANDKDQAWVVFVNRAVHRFFAWTSAKWNLPAPGLYPHMMPPLDVMMVWHTYLLNPRAYYEDQSRMSNAYTENMQRLQSMPLTLLATLIDSETLKPIPPSDSRDEVFKISSGMAYEMPLITTLQETLSLTCPRCLGNNTSVHWITSEAQGLAQPNFNHKCEHCQVNFDKANLGIRRFAEEITRRRAGEKVYISESLLHYYTGIVDTRTADEFIPKILSYLDPLYGLNRSIASTEISREASQLAEALRYNPQTLLDSLHRGVAPLRTPNLANPRPRLQRIVTAYQHHGLACLDLVGAVLRQGSFIEKMVDLGWNRPGRFDHSKDSAPLVRCIARYHAFLDLMSQNPGLFLVPTLDIDLAWHTHQLKSDQYRVDTQTYLQRTPNHDDNVEATSLSTAYDITAKAWKARFGVPYSVCGCIPDRDSESRLSRFISRLSSFGHRREKSNSTSDDTLVNTRPDLVTTEDHEADTSHPSEHNVYFGDPNDKHIKSKTAKREKKSVRCTANAKKGGDRDRWRALQAERAEKNKLAALDDKEGDNKHKEAFTDPHHGYGHYYAYWGVSAAIPLGFYGGYAYAGGVGGCGTGCGSAGCRGGPCGSTSCDGGGGSCGGGGGNCGGCGGCG